ncbi:MAG: PA14 domain-containing protein, partial [Anaerolineae bacterium]
MAVAPGELVTATDVAAAPDGSIYVIDDGASRVAQYAPDGTLLNMWGSPGTAEGQFAPAPNAGDPAGSQIAVGPSGVVFTYDSGNERIQKFTSDGRFYTAWPARVHDMAVSPTGTLYLVDPVEGRVKHYCPAGRLKGAWGEGGEDEDGVAQCGPYSPGVGYSIAVTPEESVVVADPDTGRVDVCTRTGEHVTTWQLPAGDAGADGEAGWSGHLAIDPDGSVLVTGVEDRPLTRFTVDGERMPLDEGGATSGGATSGGATSGGAAVDAQTGVRGLLALDPEPESAQGSAAFSRWPFAVAPDWSISFLASHEPGQTLISMSNDDTRFRTLAATGAGDGKLLSPAGVALAPDGTVVAADAGMDRLQRLGPHGQFIAAWGLPGPEETGAGELAGADQAGADFAGAYPAGVAVGLEGETYVVDRGNGRVLAFDPDGQPLDQWGASESSPVHFSDPQDVVALSDGRFAVVDDERLQLVEPGGPVAAWDLPASADSGGVAADTAAGSEAGEAEGLEGSGASPGRSRRLAVDEAGAVLVADTGNAVVWRVDPEDGKLGEWLRLAPNSAPLSIAVRDDGTVVLQQRGTDALQRYTATGEHAGAWPSDDAPARWTDPRGAVRHLAPDGDGGLYISGAGGLLHLTADGLVDHGWDWPQQAAAIPSDLIPPRPDVPAGDGWTVQVFDNPWLSGVPVTTNLTAEIDFDWGLEAPVDDLLPNGWSARFERDLPLHEGAYDIELAASGGTRLWLGDKLIDDKWLDADRDWEADYDSPGPVVARLEFVDRGGPAAV